MAVTDYIDVSVSLDSAPSSVPNFNNVLLLAAPSSDGTGPWSGAYTVELTPSTWTTQLAALGYAAGDVAYDMAEIVFGQNGGNGAPSKVYIGRYASGSFVAQVSTITITGAAEGVWTLTVNGQSVTYTTDGSATIQEIRDGLDAAVDAATWGILDPTTSTASTDQLILTSPTPGAAFTITITPPGLGTATIAATTPNTGVSVDLALIENEQDDWYHVLYDSHVPGLVLTLASVASNYARPILFHGRSHTATVQTTAYGSANDLAWRFDELDEDRVALWFDPASGQYPDAAAVGFASPYDPGTRSWHFCTVTGLDGFRPSSVTNLTAKHVNYVEAMASRKYTINGWIPNGDYIDARIACDELEALLKQALLNRLAADPQIPYTDRGSEQIRAVIDATIRGRPYIDADAGITINIPLKSALSGTDLGLRRWSGITFQATYQGFTHRVVIRGKLV